MEQLKQQQQEAKRQGDYRLVWVCQQKMDYLKRELVGVFYTYFFP